MKASPKATLSQPANEVPDFVAWAQGLADKLDLNAERRCFEKAYDAEIQELIDNREKQWQWQLKTWAAEVSRHELPQYFHEHEQHEGHRDGKRYGDEVADEVFSVVLHELQRRWKAERWMTRQSGGHATTGQQTTTDAQSQALAGLREVLFGQFIEHHRKLVELYAKADTDVEREAIRYMDDRLFAMTDNLRVEHTALKSLRESVKGGGE